MPELSLRANEESLADAARLTLKLRRSNPTLTITRKPMTYFKRKFSILLLLLVAVAVAASWWAFRHYLPNTFDRKTVDTAEVQQLVPDVIVAILPRLRIQSCRQKKWPSACAEGLPWSVYPFRLAAGGGGAYPCCSLETMADRGSCQAVLMIAFWPKSFPICQFSIAQDQMLGSDRRISSSGGESCNARNASTKVAAILSMGMPGA